TVHILHWIALPFSALGGRDLDEFDGVKVAGAAADPAVSVEDHAALLGDAIDLDLRALAVDDDVALPEVAEGDGMGAGAVGNVRHALVDLDGVAEQRVLDTLNQVAGRSPEAAPVGVDDAHEARRRGAV